MSYPHDRAAPVTKYAVQYSTDAAFAADGPQELLVYSNSSMSLRAPDLAGRYAIQPLSDIYLAPYLTPI